MKKLIFVLLALFSTQFLSAQSTAPTDKIDAQAKKVLDKIRKKYDGYKTLEAAFSLNIEVPGQAKDVQKGTLAQEGAKFRLEMASQTIVSDGATTWVYQKKGNEVQINNASPSDSESGFFTPKDLLNRYQKGDYIYAIIDKVTEGGKVITQIEFKPKDRNSEYSKLRVGIDEKAGTIQSIKAFAKDGSRYTFTITRLSPNKVFGSDFFSFDAKKFPGVRVEDLRM